MSIAMPVSSLASPPIVGPRAPDGKRSIHSAGSRWRICAALVCCGLIPMPTAVIAAPLLRCQIDQGGSTRMLEVAPVADPYRVRAIDINGRFRFKAVVIGDALHVEYIKLYTYSQTKRQPVLLQVAKYMAPAALSQASSGALTGQQYVYSPQLEREMQYACALIEVAP